MVCTHHWTSPMQVGSHHLAREFVRAGYEVGYLSAPVTPLHLLRKMDRDLSERIRVFKRGGRFDHQGHVWSYVPGALFAPDSRAVLNSKAVYNSWFRSTLPNVITKITQAGFDNPDILYIDNLSYWFLMKTVSFRKSVFRVMDNHTGVPGAGSFVAQIASGLGKSADLTVYSAAASQGYVEALQVRKKAYVPNGVDFKHFVCGDRSVPDAYRTITRPIAVYVGAMDVRFDFELVQRTARENPRISFVLIGPEELARKRLKNKDNIYLLGTVSYDVLPAYLHHADVGMIPFNVKEYPKFVHSVHPLKLYQYMACGLPVVSTEWEEIGQMDTPAVLCRSGAEFSQAVAHATAHKHDKTPYIEYASRNDWSERLRDILRALE